MKIKLVIILIFLAFIKTEFSHSQNDTIQGRIFSSITMKKPKGDIYILEKGTSNGIIADSLGVFSLIFKAKKESYSLDILVENYPKKIYEYKNYWNKRKKPKSIVIEGKCEINKEKALKDWKNETPKLYLSSGVSPVTNSRKDKKFKKKYKVKYIELGCEGKIHECISEYNFRIIKNLDIKYQKKWRKKKREGIVGIEDYLNTIKPCLN